MSMIRTPVALQPVFRLVDLFEETVEYERNWKLPFNCLNLCIRENPDEPSWVELPEKNLRICFEENVTHFATCDTPMRIRFTPANRHCCIHFRYELIPGVDLFSGLHERYVLKGRKLAERIKSVFSEPDPLRRLARAEAVTMDFLLDFWPERLPLDLRRMAEFEDVLRYVRKNLASHPGVPEMAARKGWSDAHFARTFRDVFHITPKQYLKRELFAESLKLLNDPDKSVKEIAAELGFSSEFNFSRFIKQCSGLAPSGLRKGNDRPLYIRK